MSDGSRRQSGRAQLMAGLATAMLCAACSHHVARSGPVPSPADSGAAGGPGHDVVIYDANPKLGGLNEHGIGRFADTRPG